MKELLKRLRKRHPSNDRSLASLPLIFCGKVETLEVAVRHRILPKENDETNIRNAEASIQEGPETSSEDEYVMNRHPMEPTEFDQPIRCPHPEPCILQDGRAMRLRAPSLKRRGQLPFLTVSELQRQRWNRRSAPSDAQIYPAASAPEHSLITALP